MKDTRANSAADVPAEPSDQVKLPPIFNRLKPTMVARNMETEHTMPSVGATLELRTYNGELRTVWLPGNAWEGVALLIRHTPDHFRSSLAEFLMVVHSSLRNEDPMGLLLRDLITEVEHDPYGEMPQTPINTHDFAW